MLAIEGLGKRYGRLQVIDDFTLALGEREVVGIIGPNGAGKTTLFSLIAGQIAPDAGRIAWRGHDITTMPPERRCAAGIGRTFQVPRPFHGMSVFETALVAARFGAGMRGREALDCAADAIEQSGLAARRDTPCAELTLLDRKRLELTRALATRPQLLLLDEIGGGLTDREIDALLQILAGVRARGVAIVWIEHIVRALTAFVERLVVIDAGRKLADGAPADVMADPRVHAIYMGLDAAEATDAAA
ncbi:MAG: ABC transporter ATP-binding protein [Burkholderiaceae bacterium]|jgi:branched-chain amino acid transport system ATP-binding protein|nr:ABC transporter ATP-binding protein [Burkholderiaceae bacterium]